MPFLITCPYCQKKYRLKENKRGRKVQCRRCERPFRAGPKSENLKANSVSEKTISKLDISEEAPSIANPAPENLEHSIHMSSPFLDLDTAAKEKHISSPFLDLDLEKDG